MSKPFVRSSSDKYIAGVAGGIAEYFNIDATIVRVLFVIVALAVHPLGWAVYPVLWGLMPAADGGPSGFQSLLKSFKSREMR